MLRPRKIGVVRGLTSVILVSHLLACTAWRENGPPAHVVVRERPDRVRVTLSNGTHSILASPTVAADTLRGQVVGNGSAPFEAAFPLGEILKLETRELDGGRTALLAVGIVVAVVVVASALAVGSAVGYLGP